MRGNKRLPLQLFINFCMSFKELEIIDPILKSLQEEGYSEPTTIQSKAIPILLKGKDLMGCAQTGTGKTAAFAIPILQLLYQKNVQRGQHKKIKALVITPTRELAIQIGESFDVYGRHTGLQNTVIFGGVKQGAQTLALGKGIDILIATPGRLLDLMNQRFISLDDVEHFVLDEADQMLDMGFIHDIKRIIKKLPIKRQSLLFSATMPIEIMELSEQLLGSFETVTVKPQQTTAERVSQAVYMVNQENKNNLLLYVLQSQSYDTALIFLRTKHHCDKIVKMLGRSGLKAEAIHGNKSQSARQRVLNEFKEGELKILVATDIAARGIDVDNLSLVINYELPNVPETYVHRIGRTGRASASGMAVSFCSGEEISMLRQIQRLINQQIPVVKKHPFDGDEVIETAPKKQGQRGSGQRGSGQRSAPKPASGGKETQKKKKFWGRRGGKKKV